MEDQEKPKMSRKESLSLYKQRLIELAEGLGGWSNGHTHLDRANTLDPEYWQHSGIDPFEAATFPLEVKQNLTGELHKGLAYKIENLTARMEKQLERLISFNTRQVISLVDATPDIGLTAIEAALKLKNEFKDKIELIVGTQPIFGFKNPAENPDRWEIFKEASKISDLIGGLPEKDDYPTRIGFEEHLKMILRLGVELSKEIHVHVDQGNDPRENGTETLVEAVKWLGSPKIENYSGPTVWAVHAISPSCYGEDRFKKLLEKIKRYNIGIICCPRAALSMRQLRPLSAPLHNSISRLLEMIKWEIPIRLGTDNIADIFIPTGDGSMLEEIEILADSLRYYAPKLWAKIGCGVPPNDMDRELVSRALHQDYKVFREINGDFLKI